MPLFNRSFAARRATALQSPPFAVAARRALAIRKAIEPLEGRTLFASISVDSTGELVVTGDSNAANNINVSLSTDGTTLTAKAGSLSRSYTASTLRSLKIVGGQQADSITVGSTVKLTSWIFPGNGSDSVYGGGGNDNVYEAGGHNFARLGDGNDRYEGGGGNETVYGGNGNDTMIGGGGNDSFYGEAGTNTFNGAVTSGSSAGSVSNTSGNIASSTASSTSITLQAESATLAGGTFKASNNAGYRGTGFADYGGQNSSVTFTFTRSSAGTGTLAFRYANGSGANRPLAVYVNNTLAGTLAITPTGNWTNWQTATLTNVALPSGNVSVRAVANASAGGANVDELVVTSGSTSSSTPTPTPTPEPSAPTGGSAGGGIGQAAGGTTFAPAVADSAAVKPIAKITARQTTINAGAAVFVSGLSSTLNAGAATTARYEWDFGDGSAKYNKLIGFTAGHVYANPGTYTITLRVLNEKRGASTTTLKVTVQAASRRAIYVAANGNDANDGSSTAKAVKTANRAAELLRGQSNIEVLFRRGDTFNLSTTLSLSGRNAKIGAFGSGNTPVLKWNGAKTTQNMIRIEEGSVSNIVEDITFDSIWPGPTNDQAGMPFAIKVNGTDSVIRGNTFLNVSYAIQTNFKPTGLLVQDNDAPSAFALRNYFLWGEGNDFVVLGNRVANVINEHAIRIFGVNRILIAYNDLANPTNYSYEPAKNSLNLQWADYAYVYGNTIRHNWQLGPLGGTDGLQWKSARLKNSVIEANRAIQATVRIVHGFENSVIRNNVFERTDENAIVIDPYDTTYARGVTNITIANNTGINTGTRGRFLYVGGKASGLTLVNNLYKADNLLVGTYGAAAVYVNDTSLSSFTLIGNNVWPVPNMTTWAANNIAGGTAINVVSLSQNTLANYYNISRWNTLGVVATDGQQDTSLGSNFAPSTASLAANFAARYIGVFNDYSGKARPLTGTWSAGAVEV